MFLENRVEKKTCNKDRCKATVIHKAVWDTHSLEGKDPVFQFLYEIALR